MHEVKKPKKPLIFYYIIVLAALLLINFLFVPWAAERQVKEVGYDTFMDMTDDKNIGEVQINQQDNEIVFTDKDNTAIYKTGMVDDPGLTDRLHDAGAKFSGQIIEQESPILAFLLSWIVPIAIFIGLGQYMSRKLMNKAGGDNSMIFGMGRSNAKVYVKSSEGIRFSDVAGEDEAKENLSEIVEYLHNPSKYREIGASMPKGILLVGPPGTGKTMLAKAVAGESNVPFFSMSGSKFVEMFVGMGASKVRDLFRQAKEKAPCIVFIDEIATLTGGRAAEELVFHSASTGASNDIEQATKLARAMITRYGMSKDFDMVAMETVTNQYLGGDTSLSCSAETQTEIDRQVVELVKKQHEKADRILAENRDRLDKLADYLYEKETITGEEFMEILRSEP